MPKKIRKSLQVVLAEFTQTHNNRYDYSQVDYLGGNHKVKILCPIHGPFLQWPNDHIAGRGCSKCSKNKTITQDEFLQRAISAHGSKYDFSNAIYTSNKQKVQIICPCHGVFYLPPADLWKGVGCRHCGFEQQIKVKVSKGLISDPSKLDAFEAYRKSVRKLSEKSYKRFRQQINPSNIKRSRTWHLDHRFSICEGFRNNVPAEIIASPANLIIMEASPNQSKGVACSITLDELVTASRSTM